MSDFPRTRMSLENRAKQFMPFVGQPGLYEALARVESEFKYIDTPDSLPDSLPGISSSSDTKRAHDSHA